MPYVSMLLWAAAGGFLMLLAFVVARGGLGVRQARPWEEPLSGLTLQLSRLQAPLVARDNPRGDLEIAVLTALTLLVTPIVWPHYYVVLVMPVAVVSIYLGRLVLDGSAWARPAWLDSGSISDTTAPKAATASDSAPTATFDTRRRVLPTIALVGLGLASLFLASAEYVEPYRGAGGQLLIALLTVFGASLVALGWIVRDQGCGSSPEPAR